MCGAQAWGFVGWRAASTAALREVVGRRLWWVLAGLQLGRDEASELPSPFSEGSQAQLLGCLSRLTPSSGFHFSDCATTHCLKWTLKAIPLDLKGPYRCYKNPSSLDQPKSPSSLDDQLQLYQGSSGYVTFHSNHQSHTDLNILPLLSFQFNVSHKDHNFRVKQCHFF